MLIHVKDRIDATPSPSRRGLKLVTQENPHLNQSGCNTVPIEKGTETRK
jgi:hypothetical protein